MDELEALAWLRDGDIGGLEFLVRQHQLEATRVAYLVTRDALLAEDIVQSAFLRVFERIHQFDDQKPFRPWFLKGVLNDAMKAANRRNRNRSMDEAGNEIDDHLTSTAPSPEELLESAQTRDDIRTAMAKLSPPLRKAVVLRYFYDLSEIEMAELEGCPQGTIKRRLHDARIRLRNLLHLDGAVSHSSSPASRSGHKFRMSEGESRE